MSKKVLVSMNFEQEYVDLLKEQSKERNFEKLSHYLQDWFNKLGLDKKEIKKRAILQIPDTAMVNKQSLETWLRNRCSEIVNHYFKGENAE